MHFASKATTKPFMIDVKVRLQVYRDFSMQDVSNVQCAAQGLA